MATAGGKQGSPTGSEVLIKSFDFVRRQPIANKRMRYGRQLRQILSLGLWWKTNDQCRKQTKSYEQ